MSEGLLNKLGSAFGWTAFSTAASQGIRLLRSLILARLLLPQDFGLFSMAATTQAALAVFATLGLHQALIVTQFEDDERRERWFQTGWSLQVIKGLLLFSLVFLGAPLFALFYQEQALVPIIRITAFSMLFQGFHNLAMIRLHKELRFKPIVVLEISTAVLALITTVGLALVIDGATALAIGLVVESAAAFVLSFMLYRWRPAVRFDPEAIRTFFRYARNLVTVSVLAYVTTQFDNVMIGRWLAPEELGLYVFAYSIASLPVTVLSTVLNKTLFPLYSNMYTRNRVGALQIWAHSFRLASVLLVCGLVPLGIYRNEILADIFGEKWSGAAPVLGLLLILGFFRALAHVSVPIILAMDRPDVETKVKTAESIVFVVLVLVLTSIYGIEGAAVAGLSSYFLGCVLRTGYVLRVRLELSQLLAEAVAVNGFVIGLGCALGLLIRPIIGVWIGPPSMAIVLLVFALGYDRWRHPSFYTQLRTRFTRN